jgi:phosphonate transport system substrate-binding protein
MKIKLLYLFALLTALPGAAAHSQPEGQSGIPTLVFGIVPQQAASKLARVWTPILDHIGRASGTRLVFATAPDIPTFEQRLATGAYDLAYMNPYHYTVFGETPGYRAIGKEKTKQIKGILVVRNDSPIQKLDDLNTLTLAFPAPAAFAASVLPRSHLINQGIEITPKYVSSHDSVYLGVHKGLYPAGGGVMRTFNTLNPAVRDELRVLWTTDGFTPHAIAVHHRVSRDVVARIQDSMYRMDQDSTGRELLATIGFLGISPAEHSDWDDVRSLGITLLNDLVKGVR